MLLTSLPEVDLACKLVCRRFLGVLDFAVLQVLLDCETLTDACGIPTRVPAAETVLQERLKVSSAALKAALTRLRGEGLVVATSRGSSSKDSEDAVEKGCLWGVDSETMADAVVFKLNAMLPPRAVTKSTEVTYVCSKCFQCVTAIEAAASMSDDFSAFLCTDPLCRGEMHETYEAEQEAQDALCNVRADIQELCTGIQRALALSRLDA